MPIEAILIDADGVIQYAPRDWSLDFAACLGDGDAARAERFTAELFAAETACLCRPDGFDAALDAVLARWDRLAHKAAVLETMHRIHPHEAVVDTLRAVRTAGTRCYVASNQQAGRAAVMSARFGYATVFHGELYSCDLGHAKPSERYFEQALAAIGAAPDATLFIDDRPENVAAARRVGLHAIVYDGRSGAAVLQAELARFGLAVDAPAAPRHPTTTP